MLDKLRDNAEQDSLRTEGYVRTFYSPRMNACLVERFTLYRNDKTPESFEVFDLSSNRTVWASQVTCDTRQVGTTEKTIRMEYTCSDYYWNVESQLEDYVKTNHLEDE